MKKTLSLVLALGLSACGANKTDYAFKVEIDQQVRQIAALRTQYQQQVQDPSLDLVRDRIALSGSYPRLGSPCRGRADDTYPTDAEKAALKRWSAARGAFVTQLAVLAKPPPDATERMARFMTQFDSTNFEAAAQISAKLDQLSDGGLTWCQFAQAANAVNRDAHHMTAGYRNTIDEELLIDAKRRAGMKNPSATPFFATTW
jgi:hypothetical protein